MHEQKRNASAKENILFVRTDFVCGLRIVSAIHVGISDQETEQSIEENVLSGSVDSIHLQLVEDELIDDYLFGRLSSKEEQRFADHFLCTDDRKQRLAIARAIIQHAREQPIDVSEVHPKLSRRKFRVLHFPWITATTAALFAAIILAVLLGFQFLRLRRETRVARNAANEIERLQAALTAQNLRPPGATPSRVAAPQFLESQSGQSHPTEPTPDRDSYSRTNAWNRFQRESAPSLGAQTSRVD